MTSSPLTARSSRVGYWSHPDQTKKTIPTQYGKRIAGVGRPIITAARFELEREAWRGRAGNRHADPLSDTRSPPTSSGHVDQADWTEQGYLRITAWSSRVALFITRPWDRPSVLSGQSIVRWDGPRQAGDARPGRGERGLVDAASLRACGVEVCVACACSPSLSLRSARVDFWHR